MPAHQGKFVAYFRVSVWTLREPIATLLLDGKTVGRHYAGPNWEHMDRQRRDGPSTGPCARQEA
jgi:hypothetical protein